MSDSKVSQADQSKEYKEGKLKAYSRKIKPSWYEKYSWICKCTSKFKIISFVAKLPASVKVLH